MAGFRAGATLDDWFLGEEGMIVEGSCGVVLGVSGGLGVGS